MFRAPQARRFRRVPVALARPESARHQEPRIWPSVKDLREGAQQVDEPFAFFQSPYERMLGPLPRAADSGCRSCRKVVPSTPFGMIA